MLCGEQGEEGRLRKYFSHFSTLLSPSLVCQLTLSRGRVSRGDTQGRHCGVRSVVRDTGEKRGGKKKNTRVKAVKKSSLPMRSVTGPRARPSLNLSPRRRCRPITGRPMALPTTSPLVSPAWLAEELKEKGQAGLILIDASWFMPNSGRSGAAEFAAGPRIPGSRFFDIDAIADASSGLPHMLPTAHAFAAAVAALGIQNPKSPVLLYDRAGMFSAPRAWYTFLALGHDAGAVGVLDGGLPAYTAVGGPLETGPADAAALAAPGEAAKAAAAAAGDGAPPPSTYKAAVRPHMVRDFDAMLGAVRAPGSLPLALVDARPAGRFDGSAPEPRKGLRSGHIPGAASLPFGELLEGGRYKSPAALRAAFRDRAGLEGPQPGGGGGAGGGAPPGALCETRPRPLVFTCGTGVTACILALGAVVAGLADSGAFSVYDGSWTEWAGREEAPKEPPGGGVLAE